MTSAAVTGETGSTKVAELTARHPSIVAVARLGWVAKGVVYGLLGVLAVPIALDGFGRHEPLATGDEASQTGAVAQLAESSSGTFALWLVAIGLALYVVWRLVSIVLPADNTAKAWVTRAGYLVSAVVYVMLAWTAISFARHTQSSAAGSESEDAKVERFTRELMEKTGGRWLVGTLGVLVVGIGLYFVYRAISAAFRDELEPRGVGPFSYDMIVAIGRVGWVGRGVVMLLVGWFITRSAVRFRPDEAQGIDGALRDVTGTTLGSLAVLVVAAALIAYGAFCIISAPRERLTGAD